MSEIGVRFVDRLVLTDQTAQLPAEGAGTRLERRIGEPLRRFDRLRRQSPDRRQERNRKQHPTDHQDSAEPAGMTAADVRPAGKRMRIRRSLSETRPPKAARIAPNQIHGTSGL